MNNATDKIEGTESDKAEKTPKTQDDNTKSKRILQMKNL